jgi:hypothetical protein
MIKQALIIATLVLASISAQAACKTSDLKGTWYASGVGGNVEEYAFESTESAKLSISSAGSISSSSSSFSVRAVDGGLYSLKSGGGKLSISSACNIAGTFKLCFEDVCDSYVVEKSKMDRSKNIMTVIYYDKDDKTSVGQFTAIKQ